MIGMQKWQLTGEETQVLTEHIKFIIVVWRGGGRVNLGGPNQSDEDDLDSDGIQGAMEPSPLNTEQIFNKSSR